VKKKESKEENRKGAPSEQHHIGGVHPSPEQCGDSREGRFWSKTKNLRRAEYTPGVEQIFRMKTWAKSHVGHRITRLQAPTEQGKGNSFRKREKTWLGKGDAADPPLSSRKKESQLFDPHAICKTLISRRKKVPKNEEDRYLGRKMDQIKGENKARHTGPLGGRIRPAPSVFQGTKYQT